MTTPQQLAERYGRHTSRRRRFAGWTAATAALALGTGVVAWIAFSGAGDDVTAEDTAFSVDDDFTTTISFQIGAPPGRAFACALEARDEDKGVVGWRIVEYPASDERARAFTETIPTVALATTGLVNGCWVT